MPRDRHTKRQRKNKNSFFDTLTSKILYFVPYIILYIDMGLIGIFSVRICYSKASMRIIHIQGKKFELFIFLQAK